MALPSSGIITSQDILDELGWSAPLDMEAAALEFGIISLAGQPFDSEDFWGASAGNFSLSRTWVEGNNNSHTQYVTVNSDGAWSSYKVNKGYGTSWISQWPTSFNIGTTVDLSLSQNYSGDRQMDIVFTRSGFSNITVTVYQFGSMGGVGGPEL